MNAFDQAVPGTLSGFLGSIPGQTPDTPVADAASNMTQVVNGDQAPKAGGPGIADFFNQHPDATNALLHTFIALASGHDAGTAIAHGATSMLMGKAQAKEDAATEQARQDKLGQQSTTNKQRDRQLAIEQQQADASTSQIPAKINYTKALTGESQARTEKSTALLPQELAMNQARIGELQSVIANNRDALKTAQARRELLALQRRNSEIDLTLKQQYGPAEKEAAITGTQLSNAGKAVANDTAQAKLDAFNSGTPEERKNAALGMQKTPTEVQQFQAFLEKNHDQLTKSDGSFDMQKAMDTWAQSKTVGNYDPAAAQKQFDALFAQTKSGGTFKFNGITYRKP